MKSGIYRIINKINQKIYIGSSLNITERWKTHKGHLKCNKKDNPHLQASWNRHGESAFEFEILILCSKEEIVEKEQWWINYYKDHYGWDNMYNIAPTAYSPLGFKHTSEAKEKIRKARIGEGNGMFGKKHSSEAIEKIRQRSILGSSGCFKKGQLPWNSGKSWSLNSKEKMSVAKNYKKRRVLRRDKETNEVIEYESIRSVALDGFSPSHVGDCCKGRAKSHGGYLWEFKCL